MLVTGVLGCIWSRLASLALVVLSLTWVYVDVQPEGVVLWEVTPHQGLVAADLAGLAGLLAGAALLVRGPSRAR